MDKLKFQMVKFSKILDQVFKSWHFVSKMYVLSLRQTLIKVIALKTINFLKKFTVQI